MHRTLTFALLLLALIAPVAAKADDWVAFKLRGHVLQLVDGNWEELRRGDIVSDDRVIRTLADGRVEFQRDAETIALGKDTQIRIKDRTGKRYTTVTQYFGSVEIEVEVRNVQHFAVETPFLAAVVKGTRFVVNSDDTGASVAVKRGRVEVTDVHTGAHALVPAGQKASVDGKGAFGVTGPGASKTIVSDADGTLYVDPETAPAAASDATPAIAAGDGVVPPVSKDNGAIVTVDLTGDGPKISVETPSNISIDVDTGGKGPATVTVTGVPGKAKGLLK